MHVQAVFIPFIFVRMEEKGKILIIDDNKDVLFALNLLLEPYMQKVKVTTQPARIEYFMRTFQPDVVLLDMNFHRDAVSGQEGFEYLGQILEIDPQAVVIFMTAYSDIEKAVKAIKVGATDFISKPWETEKLLATLSSGIRLSHSRKEVGRLREQMKAMKADDTLPELIGESPAMLKVKDTIYKLVETDANILITGESGTGKELIAEAIHANSPRSKEAFVKVNLGGLSQSLFESEMFGHKAGSFTGALKDKKGLFEEANNGTIFLDEIGEMAFELQAKLLRILETGEYIKIGDTKPTRVNVRIIAATNRNLQEEIKAGHFREDLFYRLSVFQVHLPSLRERTGDIRILATAFAKSFSEKLSYAINEMTPAFLEALEQQPWKGNIRELRNVIERSLIVCEGGRLDICDLPLEIQNTHYECSDDSTGRFELAAMERRHIARVLEYTKGNKTEAARLLKIGLTTLYRKIEEYKI